jgi:hypothetical protein
MKKSDKGFLTGLAFGLYLIALPILFFGCGGNPCEDVSFLEDDGRALIECCVEKHCDLDIDNPEVTSADVVCVAECLENALDKQDFEGFFLEEGIEGEESRY